MHATDANGVPAGATGTAVVLRDSTAELHSRAEKSGLQRLLVTGRVTREQYAAHLGQMLIVHRALDAALREAAASTPGIASVVRAEQYQEPYLLEDLAWLGVPADGIVAVPATVEIVAEINRAAQECPVSLLGHHYVLEGANNGNRYIAKAMAGALGVAPGAAGTRYLDPYGDRQRPLWAQFKIDLDAVELTEHELQRMVDAARRMFEAVTLIGEQLLERSTGQVVVHPSGPAVTLSRG